MEKLKLNQEWWLREKDKKDWQGQRLNCGLVVEFMENGKKIDVLLPSNIYYLTIKEHFYGFSDESILTFVHVVPNELLEFEFYNRLDWKRKGIKIKKLASQRYQVEVYDKDWASDNGCLPKICLKEILDAKAMKRKLVNINENIEPYPFISLPFGNNFN